MLLVVCIETGRCICDFRLRAEKPLTVSDSASCPCCRDRNVGLRLQPGHYMLNHMSSRTFFPSCG